MQKFHSWIPTSLAVISMITSGYFLYLSLVYGWFTISFSWTFLVIALCCGSWSFIELKKKQHIVSYLPRFIQRILVTFITLGIFLFITVQGYIIYIGSHASSTHSNTVLILGAQLNGNEISRQLRYRLDAAITYAQAHPDVFMIVSGGRGAGEHRTEAFAMKQYLVKHGVSSTRILMEDTSTNTLENIRNSYELYRTTEQIKDKTEGITIITNSFHSARAKFIADQVFSESTFTYPAKTDLDLAPVFYFREFVGFCKDFLLTL